MTNEDTICAVATAQGGAIGIIRVSGQDAIDIADRVFMPAGKAGRPLAERNANTLTFGRIVDANGAILDEVVVGIFRAPHSYTGENSVEISCHGSSYILQQVMQVLTDNGCRQANPGEYTQRAFLNGKMDLSQAEAVADLIASSSAATHRMAMNQMRGSFSKQLSSLRDELLRLTSLLELELDFSDHEELEFADRQELGNIAMRAEEVIGNLIGSFSLGNAIKNGIPVAIVGETNVGKSTLLNTLVGDNRAIVSDIHGTTRDVIEDTVNINGVTFRFIDTAGIRETDDTIEHLGIERSFKKIEQADIVLWVVDAANDSHMTSALSDKVVQMCGDKHLVIVFNKTDIASAAVSTAYECASHSAATSCGDVSADAFPKNYSFPSSSSSLSPSLPYPSSLSSTPSPSSPLGVSFVKDNSCSPSPSYLKTTPVNSYPIPAGLSENVCTIAISAKNGDNIEKLRSLLFSYANLSSVTNNDIVVTNVRHYEALKRAMDSIRRVTDGLSSSLSADLVSLDLRDTISHLAEITGGEIKTEEVLENIFKHFCIGK